MSCTGTRQTVQTAQTVRPEDAAAELTFTFTRQSGHATNQFAVWIEDSNGGYIKTIYATRFTADGGWKRRPDSISAWVKQSGVSGMTKEQVDSVSGATPGTGTQSFLWDGTDSSGAPVPPGDYVFVLEGTLRWANRVIYRAPIRIGSGAAAAEVRAEYSGDSDAERSMIDNVKAQVYR